MPATSGPLLRRVTLRDAEAMAAAPSIAPTLSRDLGRSEEEDVEGDDADDKPRTLSERLWRATSPHLRAFFSPPTTALLLALIIAVVKPLKALFVQTGYPMPNAPDGKPPLAIILETLSFIGNASVPVGLLSAHTSQPRARIDPLQFSAPH